MATFRDVDLGVFIVRRWVHRDVSSINASCDTGKACYVSEFSGNTSRLVRPSYGLTHKSLVLQGQRDEWYAILLMWIYHDKSALRGRRNLSQGSEEILKVAALWLVVCCVSFYVPNAGLLIPKGGRRRPQGDETSLEIPLDFRCRKAVFPRNS